MEERRSKLRRAIVGAAMVVMVPAVSLAGAADRPDRTSSGASSGTLAPSVNRSGLFDLAMPTAHPVRSYWDGGEAAHRRWEARRLAAMTPPVAKLERAAQPTGPSPGVGSSGTADWHAIAACESSGRWDLNSGNGYWGGLQFTPTTWFAYGGGPFDGVGPFPYSAGEQIAVAERVLADQGPGAWPNCFVWA
jgi:Transglycosylase-like domain